jgi:hypothetical protein
MRLRPKQFGEDLKKVVGVGSSLPVADTGRNRRGC